MKFPYRTGRQRPKAGQSGTRPLSLNPGAYLKKNGGPGRGPYPWKTVRPPQVLPQPEDASPQRTRNAASTGWIPAAPSSEHTEAFKFVDARLIKLPEGTRHVGPHGRTMSSDPKTWPSILSVRWKDGSEYEAFFYDHALGKQTFERMQFAEHPGAVWWSHVTDLRIPYRQVVKRLGAD